MLATILISCGAALAQTTSFTYQGRLTDGGAAANGNYDLQFALLRHGRVSKPWLFVYRFYPVSFGRKPDYSEFVPDLARVSGFLDNNQLEAAKVAFIADFMARPAFANTYHFPNTSAGNTQYVDTLINTAVVNLSSRQLMTDGLNNRSWTRAQVLRQIVESTEVATKYNHQAYAVMEYFGYLRRQPDAFYLDWIKTNDPRGRVTGFVNSAEYRQRFGP